jgi:pyrroline-5-carboxylate reductase
MRLGFIGTGGIASAMVTGLCTAKGSEKLSIIVSPRNRQKSAELAERFGHVTVGSDNQDVVNNADTVFLAILPDKKEEILTPLQFRPDQTVVSLMASVDHDDVVELTAPAGRVFRVIPLPSVARHMGPIAVFPGDSAVEGLIADLGRVLVVDREEQLTHLVVITGLMAPFYTLMKTVVGWAEETGVDRKTAADYTAAMFGAFCKMVEELDGGDVNHLLGDAMTPGGLNEMAVRAIERDGGFKSFSRALEEVHRKVRA